MSPRIKELEAQLQSIESACPEKVDILNDLFWQVWAIDQTRAHRVVQEELELAEKLNYARGIAYARGNLGMLNYSQAKIEDAMTNILDALEWFETNGEREGEANANHGLAFLYWGFGDFQRGFDAILKSLKIYEELDSCDGKAWALNTLGGFYYDWKDHQQSREYFRKAFGIFKDTQNRVGQARALNGIGNAYHFMGNHKKALAYQNKSLKINQSLNNIMGESKTLNDIGLIFQSLKNYEKAFEYHNKSLAIRQKIGYPQGETTCLIDIGNIYLQQKKLQHALEVFKKALVRSEQIQAKVKICTAHHALAQIYKQLGQFENAIDHYEKFHAIEEEVFHEDSDQKLKNLKSAYQIETSKKEAKIYRLKNVELKTKNEELQQTLKKLNATQAQLIQSGKMVALGRLVAGIVHEINTPIGAIKSATDVVERANSKVRRTLISKGTQKNGRINKELKPVFDMLKQNTEIIATGTRRILKIVQSLKNFSRLDEAIFQKVNIHDGLESTLTLIEHDIKDGIKVHKDYGNLPEIYCYPNELNQVFMNLLMNGVQAIKEKGVLTIKTYREDGHIKIKITDTGKGIPQEKIARLFEPGFTEKNARIRMRTGLYASYNIINKHKGDIQVKSELGKGSSFIISIPDNLS
ncbi:MAG: tetratricopeptide repeat protein [bacterium]